MLVPPDPERRFLDRPQIKTVLGANNVDNDHGFDFVDPAEETRLGNGNASYYAWDPPQTPGFRFINIDTNSEGGQTAEGVASGSSNGNIDDPQFQWLTRRARRRPGRRQADRALRPPPGAQHEHRDRRRAGAAVRAARLDPRHPRRHAPSTTSTPAATATRASRRRCTSGPTCRRRPARELRRAARRLPERDRLRRRPHPRAPADPVHPRRPERLVGDQQLGHRRLAPAAPPDRGHGQPRRHALDLRDRARRRLALRSSPPEGSAAGLRPGPARLDRPHPLLQRPRQQPERRGDARRTATSRCCSTTRARPTSR